MLVVASSIDSHRKLESVGNANLVFISPKVKVQKFEAVNQIERIIHSLDSTSAQDLHEFLGWWRDIFDK
jgi:hypothetical protein